MNQTKNQQDFSEKSKHLFETQLDTAEFFLESDNKKIEIDDSLNYQIKITFSRQFSQKYMYVMGFLFTIIIGKRILLEQMSKPQNLYRLLYHLCVILLSLLSLKIHRSKELATRITPYMICLLSFYGHTRYLAFNSLFNANNAQPIEDINQNTQQCIQQASPFDIYHQNNEAQNNYNSTKSQYFLNMTMQSVYQLTFSDTNQVIIVQDINQVMKDVILCGAFFINHIYVDIFLTVTRFDSIAINLITWSHFTLITFISQQLSASTKLSVLTLAIFALKFSIDARDLKEKLYRGYAQMGGLNKQWLGIFKTLPVGVIVTNRDTNVQEENILQKTQNQSRAQSSKKFPFFTNDLQSSNQINKKSDNNDLYNRSVQNFEELVKAKTSDIDQDKESEDNNKVLFVNSKMRNFINALHQGTEMFLNTQNKQLDQIKNLDILDNLIKIEEIMDETPTSSPKPTKISGLTSPTPSNSKNEKKSSYLLFKNLNNISESRVIDRSFKSYLDNMIYNRFMKLRGLTDNSLTFTAVVQQVTLAYQEVDIWLFVDTSEQERLYKAQLDQKYKNIFLSSVSHQLRTPLNSLQLNNSILRKILGKLSEDDYIQILQILDQDKSTHALLNYLISDMLEFSRLETGDFRIQMAPFNFIDLIEKMKEIFQPMARQKELFFTFDLPQDNSNIFQSKNYDRAMVIPEIIEQDEMKIAQVLVNIIDNAIKYTSKGMIRVVIRVISEGTNSCNEIESLTDTVSNNQTFSLSKMKQPNKIQIKVIDTGRGIGPQMNHIGSWFHNLEIKHRVNQTGIGFGLNISKRIIQKLDGELVLENNNPFQNTPFVMNQPHHGTTVTITFPFTIPERVRVQQGINLGMLNNNSISFPASFIDQQGLKVGVCKAKMTDEQIQKQRIIFRQKQRTKNQLIEKNQNRYLSYASMLKKTQRKYSRDDIKKINDQRCEKPPIQHISTCNNINIANQHFSRIMQAQQQSNENQNQEYFNHQLIEKRERCRHHSSSISHYQASPKSGTPSPKSIQNQNISLDLQLQRTPLGQSYHASNDTKSLTQFLGQDNEEIFEGEHAIENKIEVYSKKKFEKLPNCLALSKWGSIRGGTGSLPRVFIDIPKPIDLSFDQMKDNNDNQCSEKNKKGTITSLANSNNFLSPKFNEFNGLDNPQPTIKNQNESPQFKSYKNEKLSLVERSLKNKMITQDQQDEGEFCNNAQNSKGLNFPSHIPFIESQDIHCNPQTQLPCQGGNKKHIQHIIDGNFSFKYQPLLNHVNARPTAVFKSQENIKEEVKEMLKSSASSDFRTSQINNQHNHNLALSSSIIQRGLIQLPNQQQFNPNIQLNLESLSNTLYKPSASKQVIRKYSQNSIVSGINNQNNQRQSRRSHNNNNMNDYSHSISAAGDLSAFIEKTQPCCNQILVVDDNPFIVQSIDLILQHCFNLKCDKAFSGEDGLKLVRDRMNRMHKFGCSEVYPLILTDINMPDMDGIEMTRQIRELISDDLSIKMQMLAWSANSGDKETKPSRCVIWAVTAMNEHEIEEAIEPFIGLDGVSVKPLSVNQILPILDIAQIYYEQQ